MDRRLEGPSRGWFSFSIVFNQRYFLKLAVFNQGFRRISRKIRIPGKNGEGTPRKKEKTTDLGFQLNMDRCLEGPLTTLKNSTGVPRNKRTPWMQSAASGNGARRFATEDSMEPL